MNCSDTSDRLGKVLHINSARATRFVSDIDIPSKPEVLQTLDQLEDDINAIARLIMKDLALSAAVLKVINSAWVALPNQISRIEQAVVLLGIESVKHIIRAVCFRTVMEPIAEPKLMKRFWQSSLDTAVSASTIAKYLHIANPEESYALGLFHNCGYPVLSSHFRGIDQLLRRVYSDKDGRILLTEIESLNIDHAAIGYRIAATWGLPETISNSIRDHHSFKPHDFESYSHTNSLIICLKLAEHLSQEHLVLGCTEQDWEWEKTQSICCEYLNLNENDLNELSALIRTHQ